MSINEPQLKFLTSSNSSIYELLLVSDAHASLSSTVVWEAAAFGISNYIIDHDLIRDASRDLVNLGLAKVISLKNIFQDDFKPDIGKISYVFSSLNGSSATKILDFLRKISNRSFQSD